MGQGKRNIKKEKGTHLSKKKAGTIGKKKEGQTGCGGWATKRAVHLIKVKRPKGANGYRGGHVWEGGKTGWWSRQVPLKERRRARIYFITKNGKTTVTRKVAQDRRA